MSDIMNNNFINTENIFERRYSMKKKFSVFFILFAFMLSLGALGTLKIKGKVFADNAFAVSSKSVVLMDFNSGTTIYSKNEKEHLSIASMCKIMTLLLTFEEIDCGNFGENDDIVVSENAAGMGGSQVFLEANAEYKVKELIKSIVVASANDSCVAMAERICGSESAFVERMNERANELGMNDTVFTNCTGLPKPGQYSCAKDVSVMFCELLKHKDYFNYSGIWMDKIVHPKGRETMISNTNKLVRFYNGCDGGKTGYTSEAGHCLSASAMRDGMRLICVVISSPDSKTRFREVSEMFNYGFANYTNKLIIDKNAPLDVPVTVEKGKKDTISVVPENSFYVFSAKNDKKAFEIDFKPCEKIVAPVKAGDEVGKVLIYENGIEIGSVKVVSAEDVEKKVYFDYVGDVINDWSIAK